MRCIFAYNPVGGKGIIEKKKGYIVQQLQEKFEEVIVRATQCPGDMSRLAREAAGNCDVFVFAGGDGSFNEVLQGIAELDETPVIGYIPSGTVNDVAHSLKISSNIKRALRTIKTGQIKRIDCMKVNDRYAVYVVTTGAFTSATYNTPQLQKNQIGKLAYGIEGIKHNLKFQPFEVMCRCENGEVHSDCCLLIALINSKYVAGFNMNRNADLEDGEVEVAIIEHKKRANFLKRLGARLAVAGLFVFGYRAKIRELIRLKGKSFDIDLSDKFIWNLDGEKGIGGNIHVEVIPKKIKILVPNKRK